MTVSGDTVVVAAVSESSNATGVNGNQDDNSAAQSGAAYVFTGLGPTAPELTIRQSAGGVRISWPISSADFTLEETADLNAAHTIGWDPVQPQYQTNDTQVFVTLPVAAINKFYRLRKP